VKGLLYFFPGEKHFFYSFGLKVCLDYLSGEKEKKVKNKRKERKEVHFTAKK
jgi:hypothetical protein